MSLTQLKGALIYLKRLPIVQKASWHCRGTSSGYGAQAERLIKPILHLLATLVNKLSTSKVEGRAAGFPELLGQVTPLHSFCLVKNQTLLLFTDQTLSLRL